MRIDFIKNDHDDATFCEDSAVAVPRVGDHVWLRRSNLHGISPQNTEALDEYIVTRVEWAAPAFTMPVSARVFVSRDGGPGSSSYDEYARLCGAAHVVANSMFAQMTPDLDTLLDGEFSILPEGMFRQLSIWHKTENGPVEYSLSVDQAEALARDWHARITAIGERLSREQLQNELFRLAKKRDKE